MTFVVEMCATKVLVFTAVFILLSEQIPAEEGKRCYWCGPLAEQVHRSQRAPSCDNFEQHETNCEKGYTHCATVATSPPYAESRLCVKFYQDECYSLYCNSTQAWRMICPCRGDLCNGAHTDRETNAFATLAKIVSKKYTGRHRRSLISGFISIKPRAQPNNKTLTNVNKNDTNNNMTDDNVMADQPQLIEVNNIKNTAATTLDFKRYDEVTIIEHGSTTSVDKTNDDNVNTALTTMITTAIHSNGMEMSGVTSEATTAATPEMTQKSLKEMEATAPTDSVKSLPTSNDAPTMATVKLTSIQVELSAPNEIKDPLPPAEALQHNVTPTIPGEMTTARSVDSVTNVNIIVTSTQKTEEKVKKNLAISNVINFSTLTLSVAMHYLYL